MCVAKDGWSRGPDEINVLVSVHVPDMRAFGLVDEKRLAADGAKGAHRRIDTAGNVFQGCGKKFVGFGPAPHVRRLAGATENCQRQGDRRRKAQWVLNDNAIRGRLDTTRPSNLAPKERIQCLPHRFWRTSTPGKTRSRSAKRPRFMSEPPEMRHCRRNTAQESVEETRAP